MLFYATSNRRHLLARDMMENERSTAINPGEAVEEKVSLSDRFGLWLGFHKCSQDEYLAMIDAYVARYGLEIAPDRLRAEALEWGHHARLPLRAHGLPVHPGSGRSARQDAGLSLPQGEDPATHGLKVATPAASNGPVSRVATAKPRAAAEAAMKPSDCPIAFPAPRARAMNWA